MNDTTIIINELGVQDAYKVYNIIYNYDAIQKDIDIIIDEYDTIYQDTVEVDKEKMINTLLTDEYNGYNTIELIIDSINNTKTKKELPHEPAAYYDFYKAIINTDIDIETIGSALIDLANYNYDTGVIDSEILRVLIKHNLDFKLLDDDELKYYNALAYKLESYDIFIPYDGDNYKFDCIFAQTHNIQEYLFDTITDTYLYDYYELTDYIDETYDISEAAAYWIDYDAIINNMHITREIISNTEKDTYNSSDEFLVSYCDY